MQLSIRQTASERIEGSRKLGNDVFVLESLRDYRLRGFLAFDAASGLALRAAGSLATLRVVFFVGLVWIVCFVLVASFSLATFLVGTFLVGSFLVAKILLVGLAIPLVLAFGVAVSFRVRVVDPFFVDTVTGAFAEAAKSIPNIAPRSSSARSDC